MPIIGADYREALRHEDRLADADGGRQMPKVAQKIGRCAERGQIDWCVRRVGLMVAGRQVVSSCCHSDETCSTRPFRLISVAAARRVFR